MDDSADQIKDCLIDSGLWNAFRTRPFNRTPAINEIPDAVFINCCDSNPLSIDPYEIILLNKTEFDEGLNVLTDFFRCNINLCYQNDNFDTSIEKINYYQFKGPHPSGLSSTHISKIYPVNLNRKVWTINYQDIISIGYLKQNNKIRTSYGKSHPRIDFPRLANLYMDGKLYLDEMITKTYKLEEINEGFDALERGELARGLVIF